MKKWLFEKLSTFRRRWVITRGPEVSGDARYSACVKCGHCKCHHQPDCFDQCGCTTYYGEDAFTKVLDQAMKLLVDEDKSKAGAVSIAELKGGEVSLPRHESNVHQPGQSRRS